ncbi:MAG: hypothetical protein KAJ95_03500 [Gammaproteobacteria bacterium]|nr:hypothetical protein [Gammaproteobacteria bacterium]
MLEILLRIVASKGTECSAELARRLGVSHALMENMLDELTRQGYLKAVVGECSVPCERCPMHAACLFDRQARIWALSRKGVRLLARRGGEGAI